MADTTSYYGLPLLTEDDITSWLLQFNDAMSKIDSAMKTIEQQNVKNNSDLAKTEDKLQGQIDTTNKELSQGIDGVNQEITKQIQNVNQEITTQIQNVNQEITTQIQNVNQEITNNWNDLNKFIPFNLVPETHISIKNMITVYNSQVAVIIGSFTGDRTITTGRTELFEVPEIIKNISLKYNKPYGIAFTNSGGSYNVNIYESNMTGVPARICMDVGLTNNGYNIMAFIPIQ